MADQPKHRNTREALIQAGINEINEYGVANLSMRRIAKACGVSRQTINAIENNKYDPTLTLAFHLAGVLGTTVDELFLGPGEKSC